MDLAWRMILAIRLWIPERLESFVDVDIHTMSSDDHVIPMTRLPTLSRGPSISVTEGKRNCLGGPDDCGILGVILAYPANREIPVQCAVLPFLSLSSLFIQSLYFKTPFPSPIP